ncbi:hypothetical protein NL378_29655, partial [Klebsiella pneumoniae]|nr:hypothetical protein [Klebsiella pneumoniae]
NANGKKRQKGDRKSVIFKQPHADASRRFALNGNARETIGFERTSATASGQQAIRRGISAT